MLLPNLSFEFTEIEIKNFALNIIAVFWLPLYLECWMHLQVWALNFEHLVWVKLKGSSGYNAGPVQRRWPTFVSHCFLEERIWVTLEGGRLASPSEVHIPDFCQIWPVFWKNAFVGIGITLFRHWIAPSRSLLSLIPPVYWNKPSLSICTWFQLRLPNGFALSTGTLNSWPHKKFCISMTHRCNFKWVLILLS